MLQYWPVRLPRPVADKLSMNSPLLTGVRVLDSLFPCPQGGTVVFPGVYGCGISVITQSIMAYSNSDFAVSVSCGGRSVELVENIMYFPDVNNLQLSI